MRILRTDFLFMEIGKITRNSFEVLQPATT